MNKKYTIFRLGFSFLKGEDALCRVIIRLLEYLCTPTVTHENLFLPHPTSTLQRNNMLLRDGGHEQLISNGGRFKVKGTQA